MMAKDLAFICFTIIIPSMSSLLLHEGVLMAQHTK